MAEPAGKPVVLWQVPMGNMAQNNTTNHYQDDKVDWFFAHLDRSRTPTSPPSCSARGSRNRPASRPTAET